MRTTKIKSFRLAYKQQGVTLFIALIVLVAMTLAGIALVHSVDTGNVIAGNMAFKQTTLQANDLGVEAAFAALPVLSAQTTASATYSPVMYATDAQGVPTGFLWANVPAITQAAIPTGYTIRYVVDRLCDAAGRCIRAGAGSGGGGCEGGSEALGRTKMCANSTLIYYRATVRVEGPRNSLSVSQAIFAQ